MAGVLENMPPVAREDRLRELAGTLRDVVRERGSSPLRDTLNTAAARLRIPVSQVKQGAVFAFANGILRLDADDMVTEL